MSFDPISYVIEKIGEFILATARREILREADVVSVLRQIGIDTLEDKFESIYVHTVATLALEGKPRPLLKLFQDQRVVASFAEAWRTNDPVVFSEEAARAVTELAAGDEIRRLGIEIRPEIEYFQAIFRKMVHQARSPGQQEILTRLNEILAEVQRSEPIRSLMSQFERFETDLIDWLNAVGYTLESSPIHTENMTEFKLNIPRRRRGYDCILVRAISGEIKLSHVDELREAVQTLGVDEGWIVTERRVAQNVRVQAERMGADHLFAYTFDELIDGHIKFDKYFEWLEQEVSDKGLKEYFVPLSGTVDDLDRDGQRIGTSHYSDLDKYLDQWLSAPDKEHVSILGEFGTGKTWLTLHYAHRIMVSYREAKLKGLPRPRVPLVIRLRNYAQGFKDVGALLTDFIFREHEIGIPGYRAFEQLNRMGRLLLIFDGFDEMAVRVNRQKLVNNFWELAKVVVSGSKVILTCRTEHFHFARQEHEVLAGELRASTSNILLEAPKFEVLHLNMFNEDQVKKVLSLRVPDHVVNSVMDKPELVDMAQRPVLIELILEALKDFEAGKPADLAHVYYYSIIRKMERDIKAERTFTSLADKLYFLSELAWEMYSSDQLTLSYKQFPERIRTYFGRKVSDQEEDHWQYDLLGQTMLIRDGDGNYSPAHRSLIEFFVAYKFAAEMGALREDFIVAAQQQTEMAMGLSPRKYTWSKYFQRERDSNGAVLPIAPLETFEPEPVATLSATVGWQPLTDPIRKLLKSMARVPALRDVFEMARYGSSKNVGFLPGNVIAPMFQHGWFDFAGQADVFRQIIKIRLQAPVAMLSDIDTVFFEWIAHYDAQARKTEYSNFEIKSKDRQFEFIGTFYGISPFWVKITFADGYQVQIPTMTFAEGFGIENYGWYGLERILSDKRKYY